MNETEQDIENALDVIVRAIVRETEIILGYEVQEFFGIMNADQLEKQLRANVVLQRIHEKFESRLTEKIFNKHFPKHMEYVRLQSEGEEDYKPKEEKS